MGRVSPELDLRRTAARRGEQGGRADQVLGSRPGDLESRTVLRCPPGRGCQVGQCLGHTAGRNQLGAYVAHVADLALGAPVQHELHVGAWQRQRNGRVAFAPQLGEAEVVAVEGEGRVQVGCGSEQELELHGASSVS
jgi:hypothetical protein